MLLTANEFVRKQKITQDLVNVALTAYYFIWQVFCIRSNFNKILISTISLNCFE